jgi:anti-sigma factor NepR-like protein
MSEEKKTSWGKAYDANTPQEPKKAAPSAEGAVAAAPDTVMADKGTDADGRRARHQQVLPDILGKQLRAAYGELLNAPVPDAISELIKKLESAQPGKPTANKAGDEGSSK